MQFPGKSTPPPLLRAGITHARNGFAKTLSMLVSFFILLLLQHSLFDLTFPEVSAAASLKPDAQSDTDNGIIALV